MTEFLSAVAEQSFLQMSLLAGLLASLGCGVMGTFVVVKRITFLAGGIAHSVLAGMGAAVYFGFDPLLGDGDGDWFIIYFPNTGLCQQFNQLSIW